MKLNNKFKKIAIMSLAIVPLFSTAIMTGCGKDNKKPTPQVETPDVKPDVTEPKVKLDELFTYHSKTVYDKLMSEFNSLENVVTDNIWWNFEYDNNNSIKQIIARFVTSTPKSYIIHTYNYDVNVTADDFLNNKNPTTILYKTGVKENLPVGKQISDDYKNIAIAAAKLNKINENDIKFTYSTKKESTNIGYDKFIFTINTNLQKTRIEIDIKTSENVNGYIENIENGNYKSNQSSVTRTFGKSFVDSNSVNLEKPNL